MAIETLSEYLARTKKKKKKDEEISPVKNTGGIQSLDDYAKANKIELTPIEKKKKESVFKQTTDDDDETIRNLKKKVQSDYVGLSKEELRAEELKNREAIKKLQKTDDYRKANREWWNKDDGVLRNVGNVIYKAVLEKDKYDNSDEYNELLARSQAIINAKQNKFVEDTKYQDGAMGTVEKVTDSIRGNMMTGIRGITTSVDKALGNEINEEDVAPTFYERLSSKAAQESKGLEKGVVDVSGSIGRMLPQMMMPSSALATAVGFANYGGGAYNQARQEGYSDEKATKYGLVIGGMEMALTKALGSFGNVYGKTKMGNASQNVIGKVIPKIIKNKQVRNVLADFGSEATEEFIQEYIDGVARDTLLDDKGFLKSVYSNITDEDKLADALYSGLLGGITGSTMSVPSQIDAYRYEKATGRDAETGLTANEQKVVDSITEQKTTEKQKQVTIDKEVNKIIKNQEKTFGTLTDAEKKGIKESIQEKIESGEINISDTKLSKKEIETIKNEVRTSLESGDIDIDTIESTLSSEKVAQIKELSEKLGKTTNEQQKAEIQAKINELTDAKNNEIRSMLGKDTYLQNSYREANLKNKSFEYEVNESDSEYKKTLAEEFKNKANDTTKSHKTFEMLSKLSEDRQTQYHITNDTELKSLGYEVEGKSINGLVRVDKDGSKRILVNIDSNKALNSIVGHETTHLLEGTKEYKEFQEYMKKYAQTKGEYDTRYKQISNLYNGVEADIDSEVTADLVGDYLFTDSDFVNNLSVEKPTIFQKIYNEIKHLYKMATAGSQEARELERVKKAFEKAYRQNVSSKESGTQYSLESDSRDYAKEIAKSFKGKNEVSLNEIMEKANEYAFGELDTEYDYTQQDNIVDEEFADNIIEKVKFELDKMGYRLNQNTDMFTKTNEVVTDNKGRELTKEQQERFKDSKVRDENGNLLTVYHGTNYDFTIFDKEFIGKNTNNEGIFGKGFYFTEKKSLADGYNRKDGKVAKDGSGKTMELYLDMKNPFYWNDIDTKEKMEAFIEETGMPKYVLRWNNTLKNQMAPIVDIKAERKFSEVLQANGYDGIIYKYDNNVGEYVVFNSNQIKNVDNLNPTDNPDIRYSLTKATDEQVTKAENLEIKKKSAEEIYMETGAYRGADGKWRSEIDDSKAKILLDSAYIESGANYKLEQILEHKKLYKAYPGLKRINVKFNSIGDYNGKYDPNTNTITLNPDIYNQNEQSPRSMEKFLKQIEENDPVITLLYSENELKTLEKKYRDELKNGNSTLYQNKLKSTLMHEIQHFIQEQEGFAKGTNVEHMTGIHDRYIEKIRDLNTQLSELYEKSGVNGDWVEKNMPRVKSGEITIDEFFEEQKQARLNSEYGEQIKKVQEEKDNYVRRYGIFEQSGYDLYKNTAGEIEAREVQKRLNYTPEQRKSEIPFTKDKNTVFDEPYLNRKFGIVKHSLSNQNDIAPRNPNLTYGEDIKLQVEEAIAPLQEEIQELKESLQTTVNELQNEFKLLTEEDLPMFEQQLSEAPLNDVAPVEVEEYDYYPRSTISMDSKALTTLSKNIRTELGLNKAQTTELESIIQEFSTSETATKEDLFNAIKDRFSEKNIKYKNEEIASLKSFLRNYPLYVSDYIKTEFRDGFNKVRQRNFNKLKFNNEGTPVDVAYEELSSMYPAYFPSDIDIAQDQLQQIIDVANYETMEVEKMIIPDEIMREMSDFIYDSVQDYKLDELYKSSVEASRIPYDESLIPVQVTEEVAPVENVSNTEVVQENVPVEENKNLTVKESNALKLKNLEAQLEKNRIDAQNSFNSFKELIAEKNKQYDALKNKDTLKANNILQQVNRLVAQRDNIQVEYERKMNRLQERIDKMGTKEFKVAEQRQTKQQEYREQARNLIGDTSTWVDKKLGIQYQINTLKRNLRDIVRGIDGKQDILKADAIYEEYQGKYNKNEAKLKNEYNKIVNPYMEMKLTNQEHIYTQMLGEFKYNPDTTLTQEQLDSFYNKHKNKIDVDKVNNAIEMARQTYDSLFNRINEALRNQGMKELEYRRGYFPHFVEDKQSFIAKLFDWKVKNDQIPTDIAGLTELNNPERSYQSFNKHRESDITDYNFGKGLETYVRGALDWIYHIEDIQKRRALENEIRYQHSEKGVKEKIEAIYNNTELDADEVQAQIEAVYGVAKNPLNNFVIDLRNSTNNLAGKKSSMDRGSEYLTNRKIYSTMTNLSNRVSGNMIGGSISSALTNFIPITQSWGQVKPTSSLGAMLETIKSSVKDDGTIAKSTFLTNRLVKNENLYKTGWDKAADKVAIMTDVIDSFTSQVVWRSKYNENIKNGMSEMEAIADADRFAENVMAGRSRGNEPTIFNSKNPFIKMFTAFQLEVNNQYQYMFKDMPVDVGTKGKLIKGYATMFLGAYAYNALYSSLVGRDAAFDPIGLIEDVLKELGIGGDDDEEEKSASEKFTSITEDFLQQLPFVGGLFGGGRVPISAAIPYENPIAMITGTGEDALKILDGDKREKAIKDLTTEWLKPVTYLALPFGGGQINKTVQGLSMYDEDLPVAGSYTNGGDLRFTADESLGGKIKSALFGRWASQSAQDYVDSGFKTVKESNIEEMLELGMNSTEYRKYRNGLNRAGDKNSDKLDYINDLDVPIEHKNIMANNVLDRDYEVDMSNYTTYEEFDYSVRYPEKYNVITKIDSFDNYKSYEEEIKNIKEQYKSTDDMTSKQKTALSKQRKAAIQSYINSLSLSVPQKIMLEKMAGGYSIKEQEGYMYSYINSLPMSAEEKQKLHDQLFK